MKIVSINLALIVVASVITTLVLNMNGYTSSTDSMFGGMAVGLVFGILNLSPIKFGNDT